MGNSESAPLPAAVRALAFRGEGESPGEDRLRALAGDPARVQELEARMLDLTLPAAEAAHRTVGLSCLRGPRSGVRLDAFNFDLRNPADRTAALAACELDPRLTKAKPMLVPSALSETEFFRNYFTHVAALRRWLESQPDMAAVKSLASKRTSRTGKPLSTFRIDRTRYKTANPFLQGIAFKNKEAFAMYLTKQLQDSRAMSMQDLPTASPWPAADQQERKELVMAMLRFGEPTILSSVLELSNKDDITLPDRFWANVARRVVGLSGRVDSFTNADLVSSPEPRFQALFRALQKFTYDSKRDLGAVQAAWQTDARLANAFRQLIPQFLTKDAFWHHYFHHVGAIACEEFIALASPELSKLSLQVTTPTA